MRENKLKTINIKKTLTFFLIMVFLTINTINVKASVIDNLKEAVTQIFGDKKKEEVSTNNNRTTKDRIDNFINKDMYEGLSDDKKEAVNTLVNFENDLYRYNFDDLYKYLDVDRNNKTYKDLIDFAKEDENLKKFIRLVLDDTNIDIISIDEINDSSDSLKVEMQVNTYDIEEIGKKVIPKILSGNIFGIITNKLVIDNNFISNAIESANSVILNENISKVDDTMIVYLKKQDGKYVFSGVQSFIDSAEDYLKSIINTLNN